MEARARVFFPPILVARWSLVEAGIRDAGVAVMKDVFDSELTITEIGYLH